MHHNTLDLENGANVDLAINSVMSYKREQWNDVVLHGE